MPGALVFGAATTDKVDGGKGGALDTMSVRAVLLWVYPTSLVSGMQVISKATNTLSVGWHVRLTGTLGNMQAAVKRATTNSALTTNDTPMASTGVWHKVFVTFDSGAAQPLSLYAKPYGTALSESTYSTNTAGSGAVGDDSAEDVRLGNRGVTSTEAFRGNIGPCAVFGSLPTLANAESWFRTPRNQIAGVTALRFWRPGKDGADCFEYTGAAAGSVSGPTQGNGPPVGGWWTRGAA